MASDLVFSGGGSLTLFASPNGLGATDKIMWETVAPARQSGWQLVSYTGHDGSDAKFFGRKPRMFTVVGYIDADNTEDMVTLYNKVLALNRGQISYTLIGPIVTVDAEKAIVEDVSFNPIGQTAGIAKFIIQLKMIGEVS